MRNKKLTREKALTGISDKYVWFVRFLSIARAKIKCRKINISGIILLSTYSMNYVLNRDTLVRIF